MGEEQAGEEDRTNRKTQTYGGEEEHQTSETVTPVPLAEEEVEAIRTCMVPIARIHRLGKEEETRT